MFKLGLLSRGSCESANKCTLLLVGVLGVSAPAVSAVSNPFSFVTHTQVILRLAELDSAGAARLVESRTGGRVLAVSEEERGGSRVYRVKVLLPEGRIRTLFIDKQTGAVREG
ncbi:MAG: hypothetical protein WBA20_04045 [Ketobacter sp.]